MHTAGGIALVVVNLSVDEDYLVVILEDTARRLMEEEQETNFHLVSL